MAIATPTVLDTVTQSTSGVSTIASNSLSPGANALLLVIASSVLGNTAVPASIGDTFSPNLSWTQYSVEQPSGTRAVVAVFVAQTGATPGSGVVTITFGNTSARRILNVVQVASGFRTITPIAQTKTNIGTTAATVTLDGTPAATSLVIGALTISGTGGPRAAPGATFAELVETAASSTADQSVQYDQTSAPATVAWTNEAGTWAVTGVVALEIAEAAVGGGGVPKHAYYYQSMRASS